MADVVAARDAYLDARKLVAQRRIELGHAIAAARHQEIEQGAIAKTLGLTREQIRRYQTEYERESAKLEKRLTSRAALLDQEREDHAAAKAAAGS